MVNRVMDEVVAHGGHGELHAVGAPAAPVPLLAADAVVDVGELARGDGEVVADARGVLIAVPVGDGGSVLVPVAERGAVFLEHELEPFEEEAVDVAGVAAVLQGGPAG
jgi:hypothetical protein